MNFLELKAEYRELLDTIEIKNPTWETNIKAKAKRIYANRERYKEVCGNIPWQFIGVIHSLESGLNFNTHLHNGDSLSARTRRVPAGRPLEGEPPFTWEESAKDALNQKGFYQVKDWSLEHQCFLLEKYNGFGYRQRHTGVNSPYLWSGTNHYSIGKFEFDGVYNPSLVSEQIGCIPLLLELNKLDNVKVKDLTPLSRKLSILQRIRVFLGTTVAGWFTFDNFPAAQQVTEFVSQFATNNKTYLFIGGVAGVWLVCKYLEFLHVEDFKAGTYTPSKTEKVEDDSEPTQ